MVTLPPEFPQAPLPSAADAQLALQSSRVLHKLQGKARKGSVRLRVQLEGRAEETVAIPLAALRILTQSLTEMAKGNAVALLPMHAELTTQQAADLLNVSRPFLIEQMEKGEIPFRKVGKHRRVQLSDLMAYKQATNRNRLRSLEQLSAVDQELGLGY